ncbi:MAG: sulfite exporter TauE/SafE family protein [Phycisphaerales bacterium]|nr:sulfite exporter TauE/SafE family protein [Phycisphaerales bacterium]
MDLTQILFRVLLGLIAGCVGGLAGLGGSIIMIPALAMFWGYDDEERSKHHIYMAAAMTVNVVVALSSSILHAKKGAARRDVLVALIPSMAVGMILGVLLSSGSKGGWSLIAFAGFIWIYCLYNIITTIKKIPDYPEDNPSPAAWKMISVGLIVGMISGYLGIGGGILLVPLLSMTKLPLRHAIAGSAGAMWISSIVGASMKFYTLPGLGLSITEALNFALPMGAGALVGAYLGAMLAHKLKLPHLKLVIALILGVASVRMIL